MSSPLLIVDHVRIVRTKQTLLHDVSFVLEAGQVMALLGANGAGKSTLLAALAGESALDGGEVMLNGVALASYAPQSLAETRAFNAVEPPLAFALPVYDFVALGQPFAESNDAAMRQALEQCHAMQWINRDAASLSSGELLRVQLARTLYQLAEEKNCLWLLDEPLAHLDLAQRQFALQLLREIATTRCWGVIFSTHEPRDALAIADQAMLLRDGQLLACGASRQVITAENLARCYDVAIDVESDNIYGQMP